MADIIAIMNARPTYTPVEDLIRARFDEVMKALESAPYVDLVAPTGETWRVRRKS